MTNGRGGGGRDLGWAVECLEGRRLLALDLPIPDNGTLLNAIDVAGKTGVVSSVTVNVKITHPEDPDIDLFLVSPKGTRVELSTDNRGQLDPIYWGVYPPRYLPLFRYTTFTDGSSVPVTSLSSPFPRREYLVSAVQPETPLSALNGEDPNGTWKLEVTDDTAGNTGVLNDWSLDVQTAPAPELLPGQVIVNGDVTPSFEDDTDFGVTNSPRTMAYTIARTEEGYLVSGGATRPFSRRLPVVVRDGSRVELPLLISGMQGPIQKVDADVVYRAFDGQFTTLTLESPTGTRVSLTPGVADSGHNLTGFNGQQANGVWKLIVTYTHLAGFIEVVDPTIVDWSLNITAASPAVPAVQIGGPNAAEFSVTRQPTLPLAVGESSTFEVTFRPSSAGLKSCVVNVSNPDGGDPYTFAVGGSAFADPHLELRGDPDFFIAYGDGYGNTAPRVALRTFTITNTGTADLNLDSVSLGPIAYDRVNFNPSKPAPPNFVIQNSFGVLVDQASGSTLSPGESAIVFVQFAPQAPGNYSTSLNIFSDDPDQTAVSIPIKAIGLGVFPYGDWVYVGGGTGVQSGTTSPVQNPTFAYAMNVDAAPMPSNFTVSWGNCPSGTVRTVTIANTGTDSYNLSLAPMPAGFTLTNPLSRTTIGPGQNATFAMSVNGTGGTVTGLERLYLTRTTDAQRQTLSLNLTGTIVVGTPKIAVTGGGQSIPTGDTSPAAADGTDFGTLGAGKTRDHTFTISNAGAVPLDLADLPKVRIGGANAGDFSVTVQPPSSVAAGGAATFVVRFKPTAGGVRSATVSIANSAGAAYTFAVRGTGDAVAPSATGWNAPAVVAGQASSTFTVTYGDDLGLDASTFDGADVRVTGPGGFSQLASLVSVNTAGNGTPRTVTYRVNAPGGTWDFRDDGVYAIGLVAGQVADIGGNTAAAKPLTTITVNLPGPIKGDATGDGVVNKADLKVLLANLSSQSGKVWLQGDFNGDGRVDFRDYQALERNFGKRLPSGSPEVPAKTPITGVAPGLFNSVAPIQRIAPVSRPAARKRPDVL